MMLYLVLICFKKESQNVLEAYWTY